MTFLPTNFRKKCHPIFEKNATHFSKILTSKTDRQVTNVYKPGDHYVRPNSLFSPQFGSLFCQFVAVFLTISDRFSDRFRWIFLSLGFCLAFITGTPNKFKNWPPFCGYGCSTKPCSCPVLDPVRRGTLRQMRSERRPGELRLHFTNAAPRNRNRRRDTKLWEVILPRAHGSGTHAPGRNNSLSTPSGFSENRRLGSGFRSGFRPLNEICGPQKR